ncbi:MAG TPA: hypothetical protein VGM36_01685, partial [Rhizomicrobium sp.]
MHFDIARGFQHFVQHGGAGPPAGNNKERLGISTHKETAPVNLLLAMQALEIVKPEKKAIHGIAPP